ncbi:hypothetical protein HZS_743 [Henneguya salminicola]|nr:hypothetical protein HZS_743 [Henneguya salminicola]
MWNNNQKEKCTYSSEVKNGRIICSTPQTTGYIDPYYYLNDLRCELPSEIKQKSSIKQSISIKTKEKVNFFLRKEEKCIYESLFSVVCSGKNGAVKLPENGNQDKRSNKSEFKRRYFSILKSRVPECKCPKQGHCQKHPHVQYAEPVVENRSPNGKSIPMKELIGRKGSTGCNAQPVIKFKLPEELELNDSTEKKSSFDDPTATGLGDLSLNKGGDKYTRETGEQDLNNVTQALSVFFQKLTENYDIGHPLCIGCAKNFISQLEESIKKLRININDRDDLIEKLNSLQINPLMSLLELYAILAEAEGIFNSEAYTTQKIEFLSNQIKMEEESIKKIEEEETRLRYLFNFNKYNIEKLKKEQLWFISYFSSSYLLETEYAKTIYSQLHATHVLEIAFDIREKEPGVAMINELILGKLSNAAINWQEMSCALGYLCHITKLLAYFAGFKYDGYILLPMGNQSYVEVISTKASLPLWDLGGVRMFWDTKFDDGMTAYLNCVSQLCSFITRDQTVFSFPHDIVNDLIYEDKNFLTGYSVRNSRRNFDIWTKAMYLVAVNIKIAMAWLKAIHDQ